MRDGLKHLIECHCVLPQYKDRTNPVYHRFVVFSEIDDGVVVPRYAQCNNCGVVHRVTDVARSEVIMGRDESASLVTVADVKASLPTNVSSTLELYNLDLPTWEHVRFIIENQRWGAHVILTSEMRTGNVEGKLMRFVGPVSVRVEPYSWSTLFP